MNQLEFEFPDWVCDARPKPARAKLSLLGFISGLAFRKYKHGLSDFDILVLIALARAGRPMRCFQLVAVCNGSTSGIWNSLERLEDRGMVVMSGKPGCHFYAVTAVGVKELKYLSGK